MKISIIKKIRDNYFFSGGLSDILIFVLLLLLIIIPFKILNNTYLWDDTYFINGTVFTDKKGFFDIVTNLFWQNSSYKGYSEFQPLWRPVTSLILWIEGKFFYNWMPVFHFISILLSFITGFLVVRISSIFIKIKSPVFSFFIFTLIVIHPLNAELISLAVNISDYLALIFLLISLKYNLEYMQKKRGRLSLLFYSLMIFFASASKEFAVLGLLIPLLSISMLKAVDIESSYSQLKDRYLLIASLFPVLLFIFLRWLVIDGVVSEQIDFSIFIKSLILLPSLLMFRIFSPVPTGAHIYIGSLNFLWITASAIILLFFVILLFRVLKNKTVLPLWIVLLITAVIVVFPSFLAVAKLHDQIVIPVRYFFAGLPFIIIGLVPVLNRLWQFTLYKILMVIGVLLFSMLFFIRAGEWESSLSFSKAEAEYHPDAFYEKDNYIKMLLNTGHYNDAINQINVLQKIPAYKDDKVKAQASYYRAKILREHFRNINSAVMEIKQARGLDSSNLQYLYEHALIVLKSKGKSHALKILYDALDSEHFSIAQKDDIKININEIKKLR